MSSPFPGRIVFIVVFLSVVPFSGPLAARPHVAGDKTVRLETSIPTSPGLVFDCTARDTFSLVPDVVLNFADATDTVGIVSRLDSYGCRTWDYSYPEHVYRLEVDQDLVLWAGLSDLNGADLDLILLDACDTDSCLAIGNMEIGGYLPVGTYYLVVDGFKPAANDPKTSFGPYTLDLTCRWPGIPDAACVVPPDNQISSAADTLAVEDTLFDQPNHVQSYDCSSILERGGEVWYEVTVPAFHEVTAGLTFVPSTLDVALWAFAECGPEAECLAFSDQYLAGIGEELTVANTTDVPLTFYLAVDSTRTVTDEFAGAFSLEFRGQSNVAGEATSFGSLRAIYR